MAVNLFSVLNDIFSGVNLIGKYSDQELKSIGFPVQRIMSIKYPIQAQSQNVLGVNMINVVKYWSINVKGKYNRLPDWAKLSTSKLREAYQSKIGGIDLPEKEILNAFMEYHGLDDHQLKFLVKHKPNDMISMFKAFEQNYGI